MPALAAASPDEEAQRAAAWAPLWACGLPLHTLLQREARLRSHPWGGTHRRTVLLLDDAAGAPSGRSCACSCEVYDCDGSGVFLVATLYTDAARRGRGLAGELLQRVEAALAAGGGASLGFQEAALPPAAFRGMLLFSEIGPRMYERLGYATCGGDDDPGDGGGGGGSASRALPNDVTLPALAMDGGSESSPLPPHAVLTLVPDAAALGPALAAWAAHHAAADAVGGGGPVLRLPITPGRLDWHAEVERHRARWALSVDVATDAAEAASVDESEPALVRRAAASGHLAPDGGLAVRGALLQQQAPPAAPHGVMTWAADWQARALVVLVLLAGSHEAGAALLGAARAHAHALRLPRVVLWEPAEAAERRALRLHALPGAAVAPRDGKLPMAKLVGAAAAGAAGAPPPRLVGLQRVHWW